MYCLRLVSFPNDEIRAYGYRVPQKRFSYSETDETHTENGTVVLSPPNLGAEKKECALLDIGSKVATIPRTGIGSGKPGWGGLPKNSKFSRYGRRTLLRVGGVFKSRDMEPQKTVFLTGTLPASTDEAFKTIAQYSAYIVHRLKAWVNKRVRTQLDFYVWEHQKRGALHLHYAVYVPDDDVANKLIKDFPQQWVRLLTNVGELSGVDMFDTGRGYSWLPGEAAKNQYAQRVELDVSRYLAKYVSKGGRGDTADADESRYCPSRWYGVSRPLLELLRKLTIEHLYHTVSLREAHQKLEDVNGFLASLSDVCHTYKCKYTGLRATIAYRSHWSLEKLCLELNMNNNSQRQMSQKSLSISEWTTTYLSTVLRTYSITPHKLSHNSSKVAVLAAEKLLASVSPNIVETMEITHAIRWELWYRYRDRSKPKSLENTLAMLDNLYHKLLTMKLVLQKRGDECISELNEYTVDKIPV